jgi:mono/diheme cytochrome c family protein
VARPTLSAVVCAAFLAILLAGCGSNEIQVAQDSPYHRGAVLFQQRCSGCHTLSPAAAAGSKPLNERASHDRTNGPNLDQRVETADDVLFAIRNGGFSGAIMPANIVVGQNAQDIADFVAKYAGGSREPSLGTSGTTTGTAASTVKEPIKPEPATSTQEKKPAEEKPAAASKPAG